MAPGRAERTVRLGRFLPPEHVIVPLAAATIPEAVSGLTERLLATRALSSVDGLERLFAEQYIRDVIHVGNRVLLPHLRTDAVTELVVALGVTPRPLPIAPGHREATAQVVVLVLAPPHAADLYLQVVAAVARALRAVDTVAALIAARSPEQVLAISSLAELAIQPRLAVRDVMTQRVYRATPETPLREVVRMVSEHGIRSIPVVGEDGGVLGIVTDRDLLRYLLPYIQRMGVSTGPDGAALPPVVPSEATVRDVMSRSVMCISEEQALVEVASAMANKEVERLPVVSDGKLVGFLTRGDIIRKIFGQSPPIPTTNR